MGLAWTSMGGATLYIEAAHVRDSEAKGALTTTGKSVRGGMHMKPSRSTAAAQNVMGYCVGWA